MDEYISREVLLRDMLYAMAGTGYQTRAMDVVQFAPTADVVEVVRCKDCRDCIDAHHDGFMYCMRPIEAEDYSETGYCYPLEVRTEIYGFCSHGKRKDGEG